MPSHLRSQIYIPNESISDAGIRVYAPWLLITASIRIGAYVHFGDRAWYDAALVTLVAALAHWSSEYLLHGSISRQQFVTSVGIDLSGLVWMWAARETVTNP